MVGAEFGALLLKPSRGLLTALVQQRHEPAELSFSGSRLTREEVYSLTVVGRRVQVAGKQDAVICNKIAIDVVALNGHGSFGDGYEVGSPDVIFDVFELMKGFLIRPERGR